MHFTYRITMVASTVLAQHITPRALLARQATCD
jgi:hypothetical protein